MGQVRIYCVLRGIPLPSLGSFEYFVISESMQRERTEKVAFAKLMAGIMGAGLGVESGEIAPLVQDYAEEVFQLKYNSKYKSALAQRIAKRIEQHDEEKRLLDRVNKMTVKGPINAK